MKNERTTDIIIHIFVITVVVVLVPISLGRYSDFTITIIVRNSIRIFRYYSNIVLYWYRKGLIQ